MKERHTIKLDKVTFQLKEYHNFDWIKQLGTVFSVFAEQDSGNISFGVEKAGGKLFIKYAGAKTMEYAGEPEDAIIRLKSSVPIYQDLVHENLINLVDHFPVAEGYAVVFDWFDGECLHPHWAYPLPQKYTHPESPYYRYRQLPIELRLESLRSIFAFHVQVERKNYVAIDFYDGSILYDFESNKTMICDIDLYHKKPFINEMGRLWGSSRFMSPEEFKLGAEIDSYTNVYNMGAIAFGLIGGELDRSYTKWDASHELYKIAKKAVEEEKMYRFQTIEEFFLEWENALEK